MPEPITLMLLTALFKAGAAKVGAMGAAKAGASGATKAAATHIISTHGGTIASASAAAKTAVLHATGSQVLSNLAWQLSYEGLFAAQLSPAILPALIPVLEEGDLKSAIKIIPGLARELTQLSDLESDGLQKLSAEIKSNT